MTHPFLDLAPLSAAHFASIEDRVARLLATTQDVVITQGEALLPLEGAIRGAAGPGTTALNVITGPYGQTFGNWLRDCGATVIDLAVPFHTAVTAARIREAFAAHPAIDFVSPVHAEAATGSTNRPQSLSGSESCCQNPCSAERPGRCWAFWLPAFAPRPGGTDGVRGPGRRGRGSSHPGTPPRGAGGGAGRARQDGRSGRGPARGGAGLGVSRGHLGARDPPRQFPTSSTGEFSEFSG